VIELHTWEKYKTKMLMQQDKSWMKTMSFVSGGFRIITMERKSHARNRRAQTSAAV